MNELLTCAQMAEADRLTVAAGVPAMALMEHAGQAVAAEIRRRYAPRPAVVLCGPGNNAATASWWRATWPAPAGPCAWAMWETWDACPGSRAPMPRCGRATWRRSPPDVVAGASLVVDAIFGAGLSPPGGRRGAGHTAGPRVMQRLSPWTCPAGVAGDTGEDLGAVPAALTVTFFRKKPGHVLLPGRTLCGEVVVASIGTPAQRPGWPGRGPDGERAIGMAPQIAQPRASRQQIRPRPRPGPGRRCDDRRRPHGRPRSRARRRRPDQNRVP